MDAAENLMESHPDSALTILDSIPGSEVRGRETEARYALLMSMALDKNYIDTTDFKVLQPAIDYYPEHGTPDERLRTYYYQGVIHLNRKEDDAAMQSLMKAIDLRDDVTDSLTLARAYLASGSLNYNEYRIDDYIRNNLAAAKMFKDKNYNLKAIRCFTNALDGYTIKVNRVKADSMMAICRQLVEKNPAGEMYLSPSIVSYTLQFGSPDEIRQLLYRYQDLDLKFDYTIDFARGFLKIGEPDKALEVINGATIGPRTLDSVKYDLNKIDILEKLGHHRDAFLLYKEYDAVNDRYYKDLFTNDLLHADKRHQLEIDSLNSLRKKDKTILGILCGVFALTIIAVWLYYLGYRQKARRRLTEKENENLKLRQESLQKGKAKAEAEKTIAEADRLKAQARKEKAEADRQKAEAEKAQAEADRQKAEVEKAKAEADRQKAEADRDRKAHEVEDLRKKVADLEEEQNRLKELEATQAEMARPVREAINRRLEMLNGLLRKEITNKDDHAAPYKKWVEMVHGDRKEFMRMMRQAYEESHPGFIKHLADHDLTDDEVGYLCLYAIGLRGNEIGDYIRNKRHYIMGSAIRKKLGLGEHDTNLGKYVRTLLEGYQL